MKVICITREDFSPHVEWPMVPITEPYVGQVLTVKECRTIMRIPCYRFAEYGRAFYDQRNFSPLDGPDEVAMAEARKKGHHQTAFI